MDFREIWGIDSVRVSALIGVGGGGDGQGQLPPPNLGEKNIFGQTSCNIRAVDICKIGKLMDG